MQIEELYDLTKWIASNIIDENIPSKYQQLHNILIRNAQPNQPKQPFEQQKDELVQALQAVSLEALSLGQIEVLTKINITKNIGSDGVTLVEDVLYKNAIDIVNAAQQINQCITEINAGIQWSQQVQRLLAEIVSPEVMTPDHNDVVLRVRFTGEAKVENLTELKDWSKAWWDIGRGISMAHGQSPEAISVIGAGKGSIIVTLLVANGIASTVSRIILASLKVVEKYYDIMRQIEKVRALKLSNDKAEKALKEEAETYKNSGVKEIVDKTVQELDLKEQTEGDKVTALTSATKKLIDFVIKGGQVDFVMPEDDETEPTEESRDGGNEKNELRIRLQEVRRLEREIRQLEYKDSNDSSKQTP